MATLQERLAQVTIEQMNKCHRRTGADGHIYYEVESESVEGLLYEVRFTREHGWTCTCPCGAGGFISAPHLCKHVRYTYRAAQAYKQEQARAARQARLEGMGLTSEEAHFALLHQLFVDGKEADDETLVRVYGPRSPRPTEAEIEADARHYQPRPFSLLK